MTSLESRSAVALIPDLMVGLRVRDVFAALQFSAEVVETPEALTALLRPGLRLIILDLRGAIGDVAVLVAQARAIDPTVPILAFGSHVAGDRLKAAQVAGCTRVVANSMFNSHLPQLIHELARPIPE